MKTYDISLIKTNGFTTLLVFVSIIFIFTLTLIFSFFENIQGFPNQEKIEYINQALTTIAIMIGGLALIINAYYTSRLSFGGNQSALTKLLFGALGWDNNIETGIKNTQQTIEEIVPERFSKAIEQLGNEKIETRFAAIYALERIAKDSHKDHWTIMEILAAFIRENAPVSHKYEDDLEESSKLPTDIQTALTVIGRRDSHKDPVNQKLDLRNTDLSNADLTEANLSKAILTGSNLQWINFTRANLSETDLSITYLCGSIFYEANLSKAILPEANLQGVVLRKANLSQAILYDASLEGAILCDAKLEGAILCGANLEGAILCDANLEGANFEDSNLQDANLIGSNLQNAKLAGANLEAVLLSTANLQYANFQEANLSRANFSGCENLELQQIEPAIGDRTTILPENFKIPKHWK
ncbi:pentapeptide repeat-containing protein [Nostoc sp. FACHB-892]|uniref:pentapeptide repeat-containing protein n=1 Tax=Nostoc sp. FACHB-892 TaxID=2692843 RepID=UPI001684A49A|nr:pentapeptide repeat-containing protein [Nostoc sp. FACHB-892]MBD2725083.1 pentapeptide repeat-containing protein [Nostoc sp. FACHB-892]